MTKLTVEGEIINKVLIITMKAKNYSLQSRLNKWFLLLSIIPLIIISVLSYVQSRQSLISLATNELKHNAQENKAFIDNWFKYRVIDLTVQAKNPNNSRKIIALIENWQQSKKTLADYIKSEQWTQQVEQLQTDLELLQRNYDYIYDTFIIDASSNILFTLKKEKDLGTNLKSGSLSETYFAKTVQQTLSSGKTLFSPIERYHPSNNTLATFISVPITNEFDQLIGVIAIQIQVKSLYNKVFNRKNTNSLTNLVNYIVDKKDYLQTPIADNWQEVLNKKINFTDLYLWQQKEQTSHDTSHVYTYKNIFNIDVMGVFQHLDIDNIQWVLITEIPLNDIVKDANWLAKVMLGLVMLIIIVITLITIPLTRIITKPLIDLAKASSRVASGETDFKVKQTSNDEIGQLTAAFNNMVEKRNVYQSELEQSNLRSQKALTELKEQKYALDQHSIVAITDTKGTITFVNKKFCEISGYSQKELIGQNHRLLNSKLQNKEYWRVMFETIKKGKTWHDEVRNVSKSGKLYWVDSTIVPFMGENNHTTSYIAIGTDITDRKKQDLEIQQYTTKLSLVINNTGVGVWDWDLASGLADCNSRWYEIIGYKQEELSPFTLEKFSALLHPDDEPYVHQQLDQHITDKRETYNIEFRIRHKKGHWVWLHGKGSVVEHNVQNQAIRMIGTVLDINKRKEQEIKQGQNYNATKTKLAISNALNKNKPIKDKLENAVDECFKLANLNLLNRGGIFLLPKGKNTLEMCTLRGDFSPDFIRDEQTVALGCCLCGKAAQSGEIIISNNCFEDHRHENSWPDMKAHGHYIIPLSHHYEGQQITVGVLFLYTPIYPDASDAIKTLLTEIGVLFTTIIVQDQAKMLLEQATQVAIQNSQLKSKFLASMSHEIRTPMNGVLGMLGLLLNSNLTQEQQHKATLANSSAKSLLSLINDILDFSKVEAGKMDLEFYDFNLLQMIGEFVGTMALEAQEKNVEIILDTTQVEQTIVKGDQGRIRQILTNIVSNAIKFTSEGEIIIRIKTVPAGKNKLLLIGSIQDSGIGIPANKIGSLFDTFSQVDASTTRKYGGTGLGLAITKKLCQLMDGDITVNSHEGTGSTFEFSIVIEPSKKSQRVMPKVDITKLNILIVDDNKTNLEILKGQLEHWGATTTEAVSGKQALHILNKHIEQTELPLFDIAFLDMQMPNMDGAELGGKIRKNAAFNDIKLVMMTSISQGNEAQFFEDIGFNAYFPKPATTFDIFNALAVVMDKNEHEQTTRIVTRGYLKSLIPIELAFKDNKITWPKNTRILLVEDNHINQQVALGILNNFNLNAEIAENGIKALEMLNSSIEEKNTIPFTLILMDCQMPEMDGYQTSREIRNKKATRQYCNIPIIAMTANAMDGDKEKCLDAGMSDYLAKPIDPEILKEKLLSWINSSNNMIDITDITDDIVIKGSQNKKINKNLTHQIDRKNRPVWDQIACLKRVSNNQSLLENLINIFIEDTPEMITKISQAIELTNSDDSPEYQQILEHAHAIKGVSGNLSGIALHHDASELEKAAAKNNYNDVIKWHKKLNKDYQELLVTLKCFLVNDNESKQ